MRVAEAMRVRMAVAAPVIVPRRVAVMIRAGDGGRGVRHERVQTGNRPLCLPGAGRGDPAWRPARGPPARAGGPIAITGTFRPIGPVRDGSPMTTLSAAILLFFVMDPIGNIPLFLAALGPVEPARRLPVTARELGVAYLLLVTFLVAGGPLLALLSISGPALTIAGGIVLFLIAVKMVFPGRDGVLAEPVAGEPFIVPLAVPYVAGPSALATIVLLTSREPGRLGDWFIAVTAAWLASAVILLAGAPLSRALGEKGTTAVERLMGMVLVAVAVQMVLDGMGQFIATAPGG
jgi:multiple antibiotic resistance protein